MCVCASEKDNYVVLQKFDNNLKRFDYILLIFMGMFSSIGHAYGSIYRCFALHTDSKSIVYVSVFER